MPVPPRAKKVPHVHKMHGYSRSDPYFWLRDDEREDEEVLQYLRDENAYAENALVNLKEPRQALFAEIVGRIQKDDTDVPVFSDGYWHFERFEADMEHPLHCRKKESLEADEEVILDENERAKGHEYYDTGAVQTTRDGNFLAFAEDIHSRRVYTIFLQKLSTKAMLDEPIAGTTGNLAWSNDGSVLFYGKRDEKTLRAYQIWRHKIGTPVSQDELVFEEKDDTFSVSVWRSKSDAWMMMHSGATLTDEVLLVDADRPEEIPQIFLPRKRGHEYSVMHAGEYFYIQTNNESINFKLMRTKLKDAANPQSWQEVIPHRDDVLLEDAEAFKNFLVLRERKNANTTLRVVPWEDLEKPIPLDDKGHEIAFDEPCFSTWLGSNPSFDTSLLRFAYTSLTTPVTVYDYDMHTREKTLKKRHPVLGGFEPDNYISERIEVTARDGTIVPVSLVYRKDLAKNQPHPLYLYAYGSYGSSSSAYFSSSRLSLLDRGIIHATAHVRGGEEKGRHWYDDGKMMKKMNTFTDFIDVAKALQTLGRTTPAQTVAMGGSAGGLLVGAVANMAPETFEAMVAYVPFVDVVTTMLDETIPLTTFEYDEWGNPNDEAAYQYMLSYSPYDNVTAQEYPHLLVITGLHDSQVQYWEPAKWVAALRAEKRGSASLYLVTDMEAGHGGASGRFKQFEDTALEFAFVLDVLNLPLPLAKPAEDKSD
ncbi:MAG: S9 family peptidase [Deltaproteobacteria bacterium]|nr:S9 family peptidase [Deltaproteobacteria bacterium]